MSKKVFTSFFVIAAILAVSVFAIDFIMARKTGEGNFGGTTWPEEVEVLAGEICSGCTGDCEKAYAIYEWVITNIAYDEDYYPQYQYFDIRKTLRTQEGICFDFANLYAALCRSQEIPCCILDGRRIGSESDQHAWNRVYYDGSWWNLDVTYDAARRAEGKSLYGFRDVGSDFTVPDEDYVITRIY